MANIAFIGLGHMGFPMALNLLKAGHLVTGFDIMPQVIEAFVKEGGHTGQDIPSTIEKADIVITMLPEGKHVRSVFEGPQGIFAHLKPGTLVAECSTIDIETSRLIHKEAANKGILLIDAPVSGGVTGAIAGTITFMIGGKKEDFEACRPFLEIMGKTLIYCGEAGLGQAAKICNNLILGITMIGACEAFNLAEKLGLDAQCWSISKYCPVPGPVPTSPANHDYAPGFTAAMMLKDLKIAVQAAEMTNTSSSLGVEALSLYTLFCNSDGQGLDFSGIIRFLKEPSVKS